ncbi:proliferating cell nuclear antigen, N-terminal domain-containing protein [Mycena albidolilacea]|uniref:DNA sliding clamp PCNA n=1 Tax=Mycena albidolilacea TaxID=1033008 RepID=A0AAD7ATK4_9AGAR|nr:proliferating cell nuclear antigen, N-terminal domain-containing protein [Mycena albidolilacea]
MLEAKLAEAGTLKKLLDAIKELVTDANFECNEEGLNLQAMDNSHVALVSVHLEAAGFKRYRCDRPMPLGVNLSSLTKVLKCAKDDDECTLKAADEADVLNLVYEAKNSDRIAEYDMKLMDIDSDTLGIPDTDYDAEVIMPSAEFARIVRDLSALGESVRIEVSKEGVRFASEGESANGSILLKKDGEISRVLTDKERKAAKARARGEEPEEDDEEENGDDEDKPKEKKIKKEKVKKEKDGDEDVEMDEEEKDEEEFKAESDEEEKSEGGSDDEEEGGKKRKKKANGSSKPAKKAKTTANGKGKGKGKGKKDEEDKPEFSFSMNSHVSLTFSLKYLVNFAKSTSLTNTVELRMSNEVPLLVDYDFGQGYVRYYLAPKIGDE